MSRNQSPPVAGANTAPQHNVSKDPFYKNKAFMIGTAALLSAGALIGVATNRGNSGNELPNKDNAAGLSPGESATGYRGAEGHCATVDLDLEVLDKSAGASASILKLGADREAAIEAMQKATTDDSVTASISITLDKFKKINDPDTNIDFATFKKNFDHTDNNRENPEVVTAIQAACEMYDGVEVNGKEHGEGMTYVESVTLKGGNTVVLKSVIDKNGNKIDITAEQLTEDITVSGYRLGTDEVDTGKVTAGDQFVHRNVLFDAENEVVYLIGFSIEEFGTNTQDPNGEEPTEASPEDESDENEAGDSGAKDGNRKDGNGGGGEDTTAGGEGDGGGQPEGDADGCLGTGGCGGDGPGKGGDGGGDACDGGCGGSTPTTKPSTTTTRPTTTTTRPTTTTTRPTTTTTRPTTTTTRPTTTTTNPKVFECDPNEDVCPENASSSSEGSNSAALIGGFMLVIALAPGARRRTVKNNKALV